MQTIIQRPVITEKTLTLARDGWYTFAIDRFTRKEDVAKEVARLYNVTVVAIRTIAMHGKKRRTGKKMVYVSRPDWKKAIVQVAKGQHIDAFDVTTKEA